MITSFHFRIKINSNTPSNPLTFIRYSLNNLNYVADKTKLVVTQFTTQGFDVQLYAQANSTAYGNSELNGVISATDCRKKVSFNEWKNFFGQYKIISFDGIELKFNQFSNIENDSSNIL